MVPPFELTVEPIGYGQEGLVRRPIRHAPSQLWSNEVHGKPVEGVPPMATPSVPENLIGSRWAGIWRGVIFGSDRSLVPPPQSAMRTTSARSSCCPWA